MPFVIRPPLLSTAASNPGLIYIIIEPDDSERIILRDLQIWGWNITRHGFGDENFIDALKRVERDTKRRRRHIQAVAGKLHGYNERLSLDALWCQEVDRMLFEDAYEEQPGRQRIERVAEDKLEEQKLGEETPRIEKCELRKWLQSIDRTRQTNGFLDYVDSCGERPRLATQGLDHNCVDSTHEPAYVCYNQGRRYRASFNDIHNVFEFFRRPKSILGVLRGRWYRGSERRI